MRFNSHVSGSVFQETTITEIKQKIMKIPDANGIVIDGFPRDVGQALSFEDQVSLSLRLYVVVVSGGGSTICGFHSQRQITFSIHSFSFYEISKYFH